MTNVNYTIDNKLGKDPRMIYFRCAFRTATPYSRYPTGVERDNDDIFVRQTCISVKIGKWGRYDDYKYNYVLVCNGTRFGKNHRMQI
jgi:hypothetical protein